MAYKQLFLGEISGPGNEIAEGPCMIYDYLFTNNGGDAGVFTVSIGPEYASSYPIGRSGSIGANGGFTSDSENNPQALEAGEKMFLDFDGTGPAAAIVSGQKE